MPPPVVWITDALLAALSRQAAASPRGRQNRNFHAMEEPAHRLLNALEPGTYVRPHRHLDVNKAETAIALTGSTGVIVFDDAGTILEKQRLSSAGPVRGVDTPAGTWHTFVALEPGCVFFEAKAGPYAPPSGDEIAPWSPAEGTPEAVRLELLWRALF
jgi:cupin fold WbuC family metalloprotein